MLVSLLTALFESFELRIDDNFFVGLIPPGVTLAIVLALHGMNPT